MTTWSSVLQFKVVLLGEKECWRRKSTSFYARSWGTYCTFVCARLATPQTFQHWISPLLGLCSRELFGGPRKFFLTLHDNFAWQKKGEIFPFCYCLVCPWLSVSTAEPNTVSRAWYTPKGEPKKEGKTSVSRRSLWCRRCGTAPCPTPARIPTKSGSRRTIKGKNHSVERCVLHLLLFLPCVAVLPGKVANHSASCS